MDIFLKFSVSDRAKMEEKRKKDEEKRQKEEEKRLKEEEKLKEEEEKVYTLVKINTFFLRTIVNIFLPSFLTYVLGAQKNHLIEVVLLSTHN